MIILRGFSIILFFQMLGELTCRVFGWPFPGSVLGMLLLLIALGVGVVKLKWLEETAELLLANLSLFFVPAGVGVMLYIDLITLEWLPIFFATVISTFVVMAISGKVAEYLEKKAFAND
ncbi:MAG: CidA/LrgA family protein [Desulfuromonadales bacterium]|jgi:holin-like protein|nr:CidA/LrgA family protein [Desulfuromonadales bacterium]MDH3807016.1 CidA/LrgA family protein [Desulfuromonadales bacterium]MDH3959664.1 CidA/LrgA family protein [Desulfuromonadales bacterium]MDH4023915.1 CidA/LrgA family protein [Desulfuromonadales bacterium]